MTTQSLKTAPANDYLHHRYFFLLINNTSGFDSKVNIYIYIYSCVSVPTKSIKMRKAANHHRSEAEMINYYLKLWSQTSLLLTVTDFLFVLFLRFSTHFLTRRHSKLKQPLGSSTLNRGFELILVFLFIINILIDNHLFCKNINCWLTDYCYTSISFFYYWWTPSKQISLNLLISAAKNLLQSRNFKLCSKPAVTKSFELKLKHVAARYSSPTIWPALLKKPTNVNKSKDILWHYYFVKS